MRDQDGNRVEARDVLDDQELREYAASRRNEPRGRIPRGTKPNRHDDLGYINGTWDPCWDPSEERT